MGTISGQNGAKLAKIQVLYDTVNGELNFGHDI